MSASENKTIYLSPSKLNLFQECPLCFWLQVVRRIHRPSGPFPTLPSGMDLLIKKYFDKYRAKDRLPPEIEGKVQGKLVKDQSLLKQWRSNYKESSPQYRDKKLDAVLFGALDECLQDGKFYIPVDYKTRGFALKENSLFYYRTQLDSYTLLLEAEGYAHLSFSYLIYYIPEVVAKNGRVKFRVEVHKMETDPKRVLKVFQDAVKLIRGPKPKSHSQCEFCSWGNDWQNFE